MGSTTTKTNTMLPLQRRVLLQGGDKDAHEMAIALPDARPRHALKKAEQRGGQVRGVVASSRSRSKEAALIALSL